MTLLRAASGALLRAPSGRLALRGCSPCCADACRWALAIGCPRPPACPGGPTLTPPPLYVPAGALCQDGSPIVPGMVFSFGAWCYRAQAPTLRESEIPLGAAYLLCEPPPVLACVAASDCNAGPCAGTSPARYIGLQTCERGFTITPPPGESVLVWDLCAGPPPGGIFTGLSGSNAYACLRASGVGLSAVQLPPGAVIITGVGETFDSCCACLAQTGACSVGTQTSGCAGPSTVAPATLECCCGDARDPENPPCRACITTYRSSRVQTTPASIVSVYVDLITPGCSAVDGTPTVTLRQRVRTQTADGDSTEETFFSVSVPGGCRGTPIGFLEALPQCVDLNVPGLAISRSFTNDCGGGAARYSLRQSGENSLLEEEASVTWAWRCRDDDACFGRSGGTATGGNGQASAPPGNTRLPDDPRGWL